MNVPPPIFIGFRVKCVSHDVQWLQQFGGYALTVCEICSVRDCMGHAPADWEARWDFNDAACYNTEAIALATISSNDPDPYELFAYRMFPMEFHKTGMRSIDPWREWSGTNPADPPIEPDLSEYVSIGCDIAGGPYLDHTDGSRMSMLGFGVCSPLACNGMAAEFLVNRYCLIDDLDEAIRAGENFAQTEPEPGPFYLYEVLRKRSDKWQP